MYHIRCFPPTDNQPGSLYLVSCLLSDNCAPIQKEHMTSALVKWQRLFTAQVIFHKLCAMGISMLVYISNQQLSDQEAATRNSQFDEWLHSQPRGKKKPRIHTYSPEKLASLSEFMKLFKADLRRRHKENSAPFDLPSGYSRRPVYRRRYDVVAIQHDALPPVFSSKAKKEIRKKLAKLGFSTTAKTCTPLQLHMSRHGLGTQEFLANLEEKCHEYLSKKAREPILWDKYGSKYITPVTQETINKRLGELVLREKYEEYPKIWGLLQGLDSLTDTLLEPNNIAIGTPMAAPFRQNMVLACLPLSLTLLLTDGLLRWYYKSKKNVEFPHYNYYRRLRPWETRKGSGV